MSRESFLHRVREAAHQGCAYRVDTRTLPDDVGRVGVCGDLCEAFAAEALAVGGEVHLVDDLAAARGVVDQICREVVAKSALCWDHEVLERMGLRELLAASGIERLDHARLSSLDSAPQRAAILAADI